MSAKKMREVIGDVAAAVGSGAALYVGYKYATASKSDRKKMARTALEAAGIVLGTGAAVYAGARPKIMNRDIPICGIANLSDAVRAISDSDMWSSDKKKAISAVSSKNLDGAQYAAICNLASSDMWSSDKREAIIGIVNSVEANV